MKKGILVIFLILIITTTASCSVKQIFCKHQYEEESRVDATCEEYGKVVYKCSKCEKTKDEIILKRSHEYTEYEIITEATCTTTGEKVRRCIYCGNEQKTKIEKLPHDYTLISTIPATCTNGDISHYECNNCDTYKDEEKDNALGHKFGAYVVATPATSTTGAVLNRTCERCGYIEVTVIGVEDYIDLTYLKLPYSSSDRTFSANNQDELCDIFNFCALHLITEYDVNIHFSFSNLDDLLEYVHNHYEIGFNYQVSVGGMLTKLHFNMVFPGLAPTTKASETDAYTQTASLDYQPKTSKRSSDFDDFKIYSSNIAMDDIYTTEQLFYALEHFAIPNVRVNSAADFALREVKKILNNIVDDTMNDYEKIRHIYDYIIMNTCYDKVLLQMTSAGYNVTGYRGFFLEGVLYDHRAVCEGISKAMTVFCNMEGIRCVQVTGYQTDNPTGVGHAWNKVCIEGNWYIVDATSGGTILNDTNEVLTYQFFLVDEAKYQEKYIGDNFKDLICVNDYNVYQDLKYTYLDNEYDFNITSKEELNNFIAYVESLNLKSTTIEFNIDYEYSGTIASIISQAYKDNKIAASYNYLADDNIFMLIK